MSKKENNYIKDVVDTAASAANHLTSSELLGQNKELVIVHNNEKYRLRITSNNKLILTK